MWPERMVQTLSRTDQASKWTKLFRRRSPKGLSTRLLELAIAYEEQCKSNKRLTPAIKRQLRICASGEQSGPVVSKSNIAGNNRAGNRFIREWKGETHIVDVTDDGFIYQQQSHRSLSAAAKRITGAHWSGPRFFGVS